MEGVRTTVIFVKIMLLFYLSHTHRSRRHTLTREKAHLLEGVRIRREEVRAAVEHGGINSVVLLLTHRGRRLTRKREKAHLLEGVRLRQEGVKAVLLLLLERVRRSANVCLLGSAKW